MNDARRKYLRKLEERLCVITDKDLTTAVNLIRGRGEAILELIDELEEERNAEQEAYDNMPESLQQAPRGEASQQAIESMDTALTELVTLKDQLLIGDIDEVINIAQGALQDAHGE